MNKYGVDESFPELLPVTLNFMGIVGINDAKKVSLRNFPSDFYQTEFGYGLGPTKCISLIYDNKYVNENF